MKTINLYTFDELSEEAQGRAYNNNNVDFSGDYGDEYVNTLSRFSKIFDIHILDYDVSCYWFKYAIMADVPEMGGIRLARYVWNNYARYIMEGKYYSTRIKWEDGHAKYKMRHSRIIQSMEDCPLTGCCVDYYILQPVVDCLHYKKTFESYEELINACLKNFFKAWAEECEHLNSLEYFAETAEANEWYFTENGERVDA